MQIYKKTISILTILFIVSGLIYGSGVIAATGSQIEAVVKLECPVGENLVSQGSGTIIRKDGIILTNKHVVEDATGSCDVGITNSTTRQPSFLYTADLVSAAKGYDIALLSINEKKSGFKAANLYDYYTNNRRDPSVGDPIEALGFPRVFGSDLTITSGYVIGQETITSDYISTSYAYTKTDTILAPGNSGGASFYNDGAFAGIPTGISKDSNKIIGYLLPGLLARDYIFYNYRGLEGIPNDSSIYEPAQKSQTGEFNNNLSVNLYTDSSKQIPILHKYDVFGDEPPYRTELADQTDSTPYFEFSSGYHPSGIRGYYVYFGANPNANPQSSGTFLSFDSANTGGSSQYPGTITEYAPSEITSNGKYYLRIAIEANSGQISTPETYFTYKYNVSAADRAKKDQIKDGSLIRAYNQNDIYIVKRTGSKKFKRLVLNPEVFNSYRHLNWGDIVDVPQDTVESFKTSNLVRATAAGDPKVYLLYPESVSLEGEGGDTGTKRWIKTESAFNQLGLDWDAIYTINEKDRNSYTEVGAL